mmetsp:Transcript_9991/g.37264  ORF Transcript_9991/g.37264 Transcript_9991/m.37264 type:complete len:109 (+) Transcript_9991:5338-5664(+)
MSSGGEGIFCILKLFRYDQQGNQILPTIESVIQDQFELSDWKQSVQSATTKWLYNGTQPEVDTVALQDEGRLLVKDPTPVNVFLVDNQHDLYFNSEPTRLETLSPRVH